MHADAKINLSRAAGDVPAREWDEAERSLGRAVAVGLPIASVAAAIVVGTWASLGSALLVLASGALLGAISLVWVSVRTLSGDAPLSVGFQALAARRHGVDALTEDKRRVLRALKDLDNEHALGKIDDRDYEEIVASYREDAKALMRAMDLEVAPLRDEAERVAREHLVRIGLSFEVTPEEAVPAPSSSPPIVRVACRKCGTSNEPDASFCKQCGSALEPPETADATD
ncbi:MAG: zinc ribbon domain-containing protein [Myxococcota bacterium]|nr:zinc ribbon domain-containing protein [Myxococcota bacterium]